MTITNSKFRTVPKGSLATPLRSRGRLDNIDALRALAVTAVLLFHFTARFPPDYVLFDHPVAQASYGYMGVQLFFIVSGYCIYMTAERCRNAGVFWAQRVSRLQPAYIAAILITFAVVSMFGLPGREVTGLQALRNVLWLNGFGLAPAVDGVYWTLIVEIKCYLLFGILFFIVRPRGDMILRWSLLCLAGTVVVFADGRIFGGLVGQYSFGFATFVFPFSAFFLIGMLIYKWDRTSNWTRLLAISVFGLVCCWPGTTWTESLISMIMFPVCKMILDRKSLSFPAPIVFVGFISYPLYLLHQNVGVVVLRGTAGWIPSEYGRIALAIAVSLLLATAVSISVEHRFRKVIESWVERAFSIAPAPFAGLRRLSMPAVPAASEQSPHVLLHTQSYPESSRLR